MTVDVGPGKEQFFRLVRVSNEWRSAMRMTEGDSEEELGGLGSYLEAEPQVDRLGLT